LPIWSWSIHDGTFLPIVQAVDTLRALVRADPGAISPESQRKLKSGTIALNNPEHRQTLQELQELAQEQENVEKQALNFIVREREHVMSFQEAPAYPMTSEGSIPVPLRRTESGRTPTRGPNMGKLTPFPSGPSDARATGVSAKTTLSKQKQILRETRQVMT
jgi:hypothetical protein